MGYKNNSHAHLLLKFLNLFKNLCLNCNVKSCCRFISNKNIRFTGKCHGNHYTLAHTTRKLKRILL